MRLPALSTVLWWLFFLGLAWFVISQPSVAGADAGYLGHFVSHAVGQLAVFVSSL